MIDWSTCPIVQIRSGFVSGAPALRDDPRIPVSTIVDNLVGTPDADLAAAAAELRANFGLRTSLADFLAIYHHAQAHLVQGPV